MNSRRRAWICTRESSDWWLPPATDSVYGVRRSIFPVDHRQNKDKTVIEVVGETIRKTAARVFVGLSLQWWHCAERRETRDALSG